MDAGVPPSLVQLWSSSELNVLTPSLHTVGSSSLEQATDPGGIDTGMLSMAPPSMDRPHVLHPEEAAGTLPAPPAAGCLWHDVSLGGSAAKWKVEWPAGSSLDDG
ncbi:hypothetical protein J1605_011453 [Eschrichtius robustus]|uniref:Uncharacterized protein n=1 Tax=Eschrichtius robustus TaxID=9764 RepID=A0AB34GPH2_ESCRO|nr:hypothetical protein J1605_011453 [Eschrichtius robustus]